MLIPKYLTAPNSFKTSIETRKKADRIEGTDKGITTLKKVLNQLFPRDSDKFK